jgi:hypothetical protein
MTDTERLRQLLQKLDGTYEKTLREIMKEIDTVLDELVIGDEKERANATQKQRLDYAEKHGLDGLAETAAVSVAAANKTAVTGIERHLNAVYKNNVEYVVNGIPDVTDFPKFDCDKYAKRTFDAMMNTPYVKRDILEVIEKTIKQGHNRETARRRITDIVGKNKNRSNLIAKTETTRMRNLGRLDAMRAADEQFGIKYNKVWRHSPFGIKNPRDCHVHMDGVSVPYGEPFIVGGVPMMYPGDPNGGAQNCCNCSCFMDKGPPFRKFFIVVDKYLYS